MAIVTTSILIRSPSSSSSSSSVSSLSQQITNHQEMLRKNLIEKYLGEISKGGSGDDDDDDVGLNLNHNGETTASMNATTSSSDSTSKLERNVFSWLTDTIKKSFMMGINEKKSAAALAAVAASHPSLLASMSFDDDLNIGKSNNKNNPSFDHIFEYTRRFRTDGRFFY